MGFWSRLFAPKSKHIVFDERKKSELGIRLMYREECNRCGYDFQVEYELCGENDGGGKREMKCLNCGEQTFFVIPKGRLFKDTFWPIR